MPDTYSQTLEILIEKLSTGLGIESEKTPFF